jgi:hypothetical protein
MSNTNTGGPAFPLPSHTKRWNDVEKCYVQDDGMTLRDYFAAKAMQAYCSDPDWRIEMSLEETAYAAYKQADAMLKARAQ